MDFIQLAIAAFVAALTTLLTGFIWYHPKVFGTVWMKEEGLTQEDLQKGNMALIFGLSVVFAFILGFMALSGMTIHQMGAVQLIGGDPELGSETFKAFMAEYGNNFRTFRHGAIHGVFAGVFFVFPIIAINGMFSRKSWKLILIKSGYWILTLAIMGAIICGWN